MSGKIRSDVRVTHVSLRRRRACQWLLLPAMQCLLPRTLFAATTASARLWPAQEYTRLILESPTPLTHQLLAMQNPNRLVLDLDDVEFSRDLAQLGQHVQSGDPYIQSIRVSQFRSNVLRVVLDLKTEVDAQLFTLKPVGEYGNRVVLDLYPLTPSDPLMALLEFERSGGLDEAPAAEPPATKAAPPSRAPESGKRAPGTRRLLLIALDPGHGGEDPGAIGQRGTRADQRFASSRPIGARWDRRNQRAAQRKRRAGGIRGAESTGHPVDPGGDGVYLQSRRRTEIVQRSLPAKIRGIDLWRCEALFRSKSRARTRQLEFSKGLC